MLAVVYSLLTGFAPAQLGSIRQRMFPRSATPP